MTGHNRAKVADVGRSGQGRREPSLQFHESADFSRLLSCTSNLALVLQNIECPHMLARGPTATGMDFNANFWHFFRHLADQKMPISVDHFRHVDLFAEAAWCHKGFNPVLQRTKLRALYHLYTKSISFSPEPKKCTTFGQRSGKVSRPLACCESPCLDFPCFRKGRSTKAKVVRIRYKNLDLYIQHTHIYI